MRVWQKRELFVQSENFEGWLFSLARNLIYNFLKSNLKKPLPVLLSGDDYVADALTPDLQTEGRAAYQLLLKGIEALSEKKRQVFKMSRLVRQEMPILVEI